MRRQCQLLSVAAAVACLALPAITRAELVVNGGFETGSFFPWSAPPFVPLGQPNPQYFSVGFNSGHNGGRYAVMSSTLIRYIDQLLPTEAGQDYELSFWLRRPANVPATFLVRWEGATVFSETIFLPNSTNWFQFTVPLHSTFNGSLLELGQADFPLEFHLDDVSVVQIPAPSAAAVFVMGCAVAACRRRQRWGVRSLRLTAISAERARLPLLSCPMRFHDRFAHEALRD